MWNVSRSVNTSLRVLVLIALSTFAQGCAPLPVLYPGATTTYIDETYFDVIQTGKTSKDDVLLVLGSPDRSIDGGSRWIYKVETKQPGGVGGCLFVLGASEAFCSDPSNRILIFLDFSFDHFDILNDKQLQSVRDGVCTETNICSGDNGRSLIVLASIDADITAKRFQAEPGQCAVYAYIEQSGRSGNIQIDESGAIFDFSDIQYYRFDLDNGEHTVTIGYFLRSGIRDRSESLKVPCESDDIYFVVGRSIGADQFSISLALEADGLREISNRRLVQIPKPWRSPHGAQTYPVP